VKSFSFIINADFDCHLYSSQSLRSSTLHFGHFGTQA